MRRLNDVCVGQCEGCLPQLASLHRGGFGPQGAYGTPPASTGDDSLYGQPVRGGGGGASRVGWGRGPALGPAASSAADEWRSDDEDSSSDGDDSGDGGESEMSLSQRGAGGGERLQRQHQRLERHRQRRLRRRGGGGGGGGGYDTDTSWGQFGALASMAPAALEGALACMMPGGAGYTLNPVYPQA
jgi:hypothetical protein